MEPPQPPQSLKRKATARAAGESQALPASVTASPTLNPETKRHANFPSPAAAAAASKSSGIAALEDTAAASSEQGAAGAVPTEADHPGAVRFALDDLVKARATGGAPSGGSSAGDGTDETVDSSSEAGDCDTSHMSEMSVYLSLSEDSEDDDDDDDGGGNGRVERMPLGQFVASSTGAGSIASAVDKPPAPDLSWAPSPHAAVDDSSAIQQSLQAPPAQQQSTTSDGATAGPASTAHVPSSPGPQLVQEGAMPVEEDNDDACCDVFDEYQPEWVQKFRLQCVRHPDKLVETTSLASTTYSEPIEYDIRPTVFEHMLPGSLSDAQLETCMVAGARHQMLLPNGSRAAFFLGDGAGVGKGRQIASVIMDSWLRGRTRHIWISVSGDLCHDATRDLKDIGAGGIMVRSITDFDYGPIAQGKNNFKEGVLFLTYRSLISETKRDGKLVSRFQQAVEWFANCAVSDAPDSDYDGCVVFDEAHKAKNLSTANPTKSATRVLELQRALKRSRVLYASATGASDVYQMAYMDKMGIWGPGCAFEDFGTFSKFVEKQGVGCMELLASELKGRGAYLSRTLSYADATFEVVRSELTEDMRRIWNAAATFWTDSLRVLERALYVAALPESKSRFLIAQYWGAHQRFFKQLCICFKIDKVVRLCHQAVAEGKCVVIGMQSTGEAALNEWLSNLDSLDGQTTQKLASLPRDVARQFINQMPGGVGAGISYDDKLVDIKVDDGDDEMGDTESKTEESSDGTALKDGLSPREAAAAASDQQDEEDEDNSSTLSPALQARIAKLPRVEEQLPAMKEYLREQLAALELPPNPLDDLVRQLICLSFVCCIDASSCSL
eukprot:SAG31_NODE_6_length_43291_cov_191.503496_16_plen_839_part_00